MDPLVSWIGSSFKERSASFRECAGEDAADLTLASVLLRDRVKTAPASGEMAVDAERSSRWIDESSSSACVSGERIGEVSRDNWEVRLSGSDWYKSKPAEPRSDITSARWCSLTCQASDVSKISQLRSHRANNTR